MVVKLSKVMLCNLNAMVANSMDSSRGRGGEKGVNVWLATHLNFKPFVYNAIGDGGPFASQPPTL